LVWVFYKHTETANKRTIPNWHTHLSVQVTDHLEGKAYATASRATSKPLNGSGVGIFSIHCRTWWLTRLQRAHKASPSSYGSEGAKK